MSDRESTDKMVISGLTVYGYHGVFPEENKLGQRFVVDLELRLPLGKAGRSDDLRETVDYTELCARVKEIVGGEPAKLIETVAELVATRLLQLYTIIDEVTVRIPKPHPPVDLHFDGVTVEIRRKRV